MCFSQTLGSLGVVVNKADVLTDPGLMINKAGRIKRQRNSEYWQEVDIRYTVVSEWSQLRNNP